VTRASSSVVIAIWFCIVAVQLELLAPARAPVQQPGIQWKHLSSAKGDLPLPGESNEQTGVIVADLDRDGVNGFGLGFRQKAPALVWYRRNPGEWS